MTIFDNAARVRKRKMAWMRDNWPWWITFTDSYSDKSPMYVSRGGLSFSFGVAPIDNLRAYSAHCSILFNQSKRIISPYGVDSRKEKEYAVYIK